MNDTGIPTLSEILSVRKSRLSLQREADLLEQTEKGLQNALIQHMNERGLDYLKDGDDEVSLITTDEPNVVSWPALLDHILATGSVDLLQKRLTASAVKKRWDDDASVPGVESVVKQTLKFNI